MPNVELTRPQRAEIVIRDMGDESAVSVTRWTNGDGYDVAVSSKGLGCRLVALTSGEVDALRLCLARLDVAGVDEGSEGDE